MQLSQLKAPRGSNFLFGSSRDVFVRSILDLAVLLPLMCCCTLNSLFMQVSNSLELRLQLLPLLCPGVELLGQRAAFCYFVIDLRSGGLNRSPELRLQQQKCVDLNADAADIQRYYAPLHTRCALSFLFVACFATTSWTSCSCV